MIFLFSLLLSLVGGVLYRMRGGWPDVPRPLEQLAFCAILYVAMHFAGVNVWAALAAYAFAVGMCMKGHGHTMNYSTPVNMDKLEDYEFFTKWLIGKVPDYWYKVIAHSFGGLIMTLLPGMAVFFYEPVHGAIIAISGTLKGVAYMIGWFLHPAYEDGPLKLRFGKFTIDSSTAWGEFLTGAFIWLVVALVIL